MSFHEILFTLFFRSLHVISHLHWRSVYIASEYNSNLYNTILAPNNQIELFKQHFSVDISNQFESISHHLAHAASAFYPSNFKNSLVFVADGMGEMSSISGYLGCDNKLEPLFEYDLLSSIGMLYSVMTMHLGFYPNNDEYKVMGLAPYGDKTAYKDFFENEIHLLPKGRIQIPSFLENKSEYDKQTYHGMLAYISEHLGPARKPDTEIKKRHKDIAAALQERLNQAILHIVRYWQEQTNSEYFCYAGGVALNCVANGKIRESNLFKKIFIQPAAGDVCAGPAWMMTIG